ncbi:type I toxin-antitoxin system Hok family toxin [Escherichia coli]|nr:type I toxin-antitoxin system Hok family toxin [Escherichia coli]
MCLRHEHQKADREKPQLICLTVIVTALVTRKDLCEVRIRTGQTEVAVFTAYEPEE